MNPRWLLRASQWARNPPSASKVWLVLGVIAACLALAGGEYLLGGGDVERVRQQNNLRPFTSN